MTSPTTPAPRVAAPRRTRRAEDFFRSWTRGVLRLRAPLLVLTVLGTAWLGGAALGLTVDNSIEVFMDSGSERAAVMRELQGSFGHDAYIVALVEGDVFSVPYLARLRRLHQALAAIDVPVASLGSSFFDRAAARERNRRGLGAAGVPVSGPAPTSARARGTGFDFEDATAVGDGGWGDERGGSVIERVTSLCNARQLERDGDSLRVRGLLEREPSVEALPALRAAVLANPALVGRLVNRTGTHSVVLIQTGFMAESDRARVFDEVVAIARAHEAPGFDVQPAGLPAINATLDRMMHADAARLVSAAVALTLLVLWWIFRHPIGVAGPILVVLQALVWMLGAVALSGVPFTVIMNILPSFLICVGVADSVHIQSVYRDRRRQGTDNDTAIVEAVATSGLSVFYTTATTCAGLLSFRMASVDTIRDTGTFGALGVAAALLHTMVFLPILLSFNRRSLLGARPPSEGRSRADRWLGLCDAASRPTARGALRTRVTLAVGALLMLLSAAASSQLSVHQDFLDWLPKDHPTRVAFDAFDRELGGVADISLLIRPLDGRDMRDRELLVALGRFERHIQEYRDPRTGTALVANVVSLLDPIRESWKVFAPSDSAPAGLPDTQQGVTDMVTLFESAAPEHLRELASIDMGQSVMTVRVPWLDAFAYEPLTRHLATGIGRYLGGLAEVRLTGSAINTFQISSGLTLDLLRSFGVALIVITIMMVLVLGELKLGLIAMFPNLLPVIAVGACMAWAGIAIDIGTLLVASVAIGLAVDDTIHFVHQFKVAYDEHGLVERSLRHAFEHSGRAMVATSLILGVGDLVLLLASVVMLQRFGALCALTVLFALLADLLLAPALLRAFYRDRRCSSATQSAGRRLFAEAR